MKSLDGIFVSFKFLLIIGQDNVSTTTQSTEGHTCPTCYTLSNETNVVGIESAEGTEPLWEVLANRMTTRVNVVRFDKLQLRTPATN